jgi:hypothetical protein
MDIQAVDLQLLRALLTPELKLAPGRELMARVVQAQGEQRGQLSIAGNLLEAELPKLLKAGDEVRLVVREVSAEKVVLSLQQMSPPVAPPPVMQLPGGGRLRVTDQEQSSAGSPGGGPDTHTVSIRYEGPALGPIDLRFQLDPSALRLTVTAAAGEPYELAHGAAASLADSLSAALDQTVSVSVAARHDPLEVYA